MIFHRQQKRVKDLNIIINDTNIEREIVEKIVAPNCSYSGFSYHVVNSYLNAYDPICKLKSCFVCLRIII